MEKIINCGEYGMAANAKRINEFDFLNEVAVKSTEGYTVCKAVSASDYYNIEGLLVQVFYFNSGRKSPKGGYRNNGFECRVYGLDGKEIYRVCNNYEKLAMDLRAVIAENMEVSESTEMSEEEKVKEFIDNGLADDLYFASHIAVMREEQGEDFDLEYEVGNYVYYSFDEGEVSDGVVADVVAKYIWLLEENGDISWFKKEKVVLAC